MPVWRELLADLITPVAAFARLCRDDEPGFLLESVEHGERWSRWSFVGRRPAGHASPPAAATSRSTATLPDGDPARPGHPRRRRACSAVYRSPEPRRAARRCTAASSATSATTSCARSSTCPTSRPTTVGLPDAVHVDHRRAGGVRPLAPAGHAHRQRAGSRPAPTDAELDAAYDEAVARLDQLAADGARPLDEPLVEPPDPDDDAARGHARRWAPTLYRRGGRGGQGAHPRRRHLPGRAGAAVRPRARRRPVRRLPGAAPGQPEPVHVLRAPARADAGRLVARADGAAARRAG